MEEAEKNHNGPGNKTNPTETEQAEVILLEQERELVRQYLPSVQNFGFDKDGNIMAIERSGYIDVKGLVKNVLPQQFRRYFMYNVEFNSRLADERTSQSVTSPRPAERAASTCCEQLSSRG